MDANAKLGSNYITHDLHAISDNGKLLRDLLQRQNLTCLNSHEMCVGTITRHRKTILGDEKAVLDFIIACDQLTPYLERMVVDEKRVNVLTKYATSKGVRIKSESDHNPLYAEFNLRFIRGKTTIRREIFDFKNQESLDKFSEITNNSEKLRTCFKGNLSTKAATAKKDHLGNLITAPSALKDLYLSTYKDRLEHRKMDERYQDIRALKSHLWDLRFESLKGKPFTPWTIDDLEAATKSLKNNQSRDPNDMINELFKPNIAGKDLKKALVDLLNLVLWDLSICNLQILLLHTKTKAVEWNCQMTGEFFSWQF
jgi:hypothetical protein